MQTGEKKRGERELVPKMAYQIPNQKSSEQESNDRSRTSGANTRPRQSHRPIYEDFQPHFELKEEEEAHIVQVHLPGFKKEQARITYVNNPGVIRVYGQRPLDNNIWSRFNQTFPVQRNCDASKIHGKFSNGILTITIPKKFITWTATAEPAATTVKPKPHEVQEDPIPSKPSLTTPAGPPTDTSSDTKGREVISQTAAAASKAEKATFTARDEREMDDKNGRPPLAPPNGTAAETKAHEDTEDETLPKPISSIQKEKQRDEKRLIPLTSPETGIGEPKSDEGDQDGKRGKASVKSVYGTGVENKDQKEAKGKADAEPKNAENVVETNIHKERETDERSKEVSALLKILEREKNKGRGFSKPKEEGSTAAHVMAAAKEHMKNLRSGMNDEEKQKLIKMGAAVLVLMVLGASASYSLWSSGKGKN
ncbi:inactive protein RESTRICTED TEV MOVEMENT 2 [Pyrus ussuriensis x Pyrus communis]|uniref:Inactive protein RESTRICTED TEV MOVEMENT 2 n=1 Tax=Pyrus ussuriensis x Pyrus communis TaxID=2448454 RepID=A0A5N5EVC6_9ROSA|nr:inactive protein RESTRICTED TEV MOVEMENT 2 [Pyrus ussuriensis x Pyrus communis]